MHSSPRHFMEVSVQLHAPAALPQGRGSGYPLHRRLSSLLSSVGAYTFRTIISKQRPLRSIYGVLPLKNITL
jgi:hypothetical protein